MDPNILISSLAIPAWFLDRNNVVAATNPYGPSLYRKMTLKSYSSEYMKNGMDRARIRRDYGRPFYYEALPQGTLCVAYDAMTPFPGLFAEDYRWYTNFYAGITRLMETICKAEDAPELAWMREFRKTTLYNNLCDIREHFPRLMPFQEGVALLKTLSCSSEPLHLVQPSEPSLYVDLNDVTEYYILLTAIQLLVKRLSNIRSMALHLREQEIDLVLYFNIQYDTEHRETVAKAMAALKAEADRSLSVIKLRYEQDSDCIACHMEYAEALDNLSVRSRVYRIEPLQQFSYKKWIDLMFCVYDAVMSVESVFKAGKLLTV